MLEIRVYFARI